MMYQDISKGPSRKLKLVSDGSASGSHIIDVASGERVKGVKKIELTISGGRVTSVLLHLRTIEIDLCGQITTITNDDLFFEPPPEATVIQTQIDALQLPDDIRASQLDPQVYYNREAHP